MIKPDLNRNLIIIIAAGRQSLYVNIMSEAGLYFPGSDIALQRSGCVSTFAKLRLPPTFTTTTTTTVLVKYEAMVLLPTLNCGNSRIHQHNVGQVGSVKLGQ
ncbi:hypothetical protein RRG08_057827 [Elysia crispata]|uniref:Uncharacterized protein n=1 Tax=Elysia crispata TaxID=231223 RepID=A0AAE1E6Y9_9GAST|nr:hypothetical protein RRG08_057827 [Elysia crispata]